MWRKKLEGIDMAVGGKASAPGVTFADRLWDAIAEGRRLDAYDMIREKFPNEHFTTLASLHRLFPDRVAPITEKDRT